MPEAIIVQSRQLTRESSIKYCFAPLRHAIDVDKHEDLEEVEISL